MNVFKKLVLYCSLLNMVMAPALSHAQTEQNFSQEEANKINKVAAEFPSAQGYRFVFEEDGLKRKIVVYDKDNNPAVDIPLSDAETLKNFSPRKINERLKSEMTRVLQTSKGAFAHSAKNLPSESAIFFMAMGALVASQLITNYASNPLGLQQHIQHQLSPVGLFGFYTFMASQGITSNVLSAYITNPTFGKYLIPYLGMSVGAFVQSNLSLMLSDPNVKACSKLIMGETVAGLTSVQQAIYAPIPGMANVSKIAKAGSDKIVQSLQVKAKDYEKGVDDVDPCHIAYQHMVVDQVPTITSMLMSSFLAAGIEKIVELSATRITVFMIKKRIENRLAIASIDVAFWLFPGTAEVKGFRLLVTKGLKIGLFVGLDHWLSSKVSFAWKSQTDGADFRNVDKMLVQQILHQKRNKWSADPTSFLAELKNFQRKSAEWRQINLGDVYSAHQNWMEMLQQLVTMYNASHHFYGAYVEQIIAAKAGDPNAQLNLQHPFNGIIAKGLSPDSKELYYSEPDSLVDRQKQTVQEVSKYIYDSIANGSFKKSGLSAQAIDVLKLAQWDLSSDDNYRKGLGILKIKSILSTSSVYVGANYSEFAIKGTPLHNEYKKLTSMLGEPDPITEKGLGFLRLYEKFSPDAENLKGLQWPRFDSKTQLASPSITEYFVSQMIFGPSLENNEVLINKSAGFPATFNPPRITKGGDVPQILQSNKSSTNTIYTQVFSLHDGWLNNTLMIKPKAAYTNVNEFMKTNTLQTIITPKGNNNFEFWWKAMTESQMIEAFDIYAEKYQAIVVSLVKKIFNTGMSSLNAGPMGNGAIQSSFQEARVYQLVLGELLKDTYREQHKTELPQSYFYTEKQPVGAFLSNSVAHKKTLGFHGVTSLAGFVSLLTPLREAGTMEFDRLAEPFNHTTNGPAFSADIVRKPRGYSLTAQARVEGEMYQLAQLLKRIKIRSVPKSYWFDGQVIDSDLANYELDEQSVKIDDAIEKFGKLLGVSMSENKDLLKDSLKEALASGSPDTALVQLSDAQKKLARAALQNLSSVANEILNYGKIANAVSWDEIQNLKTSNKENIQFKKDAGSRKIRRSLLDIN